MFELLSMNLIVKTLIIWENHHLQKLLTLPVRLNQIRVVQTKIDNWKSALEYIIGKRIKENEFGSVNLTSDERLYLTSEVGS